VGIAAGLLAIGDRGKVTRLDEATCRRVLDRVRTMVEESVDRMETGAGHVVLLAVGGGAFMIPDRLEGVSRVVRVANGDCANAVGAAIAQVSGEVDQVFREMTRDDALAAAERLAAEL